MVEVPLDISETGRGPMQELNEESPFSIKDYTFLNCTLCLSELSPPSLFSREINEEHVENLIKLFKEKGFNPVMGTFVVVPRLEDGETVKQDKDGSLMDQCFLVDGRHRYTALERVYQEDPDKWAHLWNKAPIACVQRKDKVTITVLEQLALSAYFNDLSSAVLKVSFLDHLHAAIQTAKVLALYTRNHPGRLSVRLIAKELQDRRTLGAIDERQLRRYAAVAQKLAQSDDYYKCIKVFCNSSSGIGLVHLNSRVLLSFTPMNLWQLALCSLRSLVTNGVKGSFENMHVSFYTCVKKMFDFLEQTATYKKTSIQALMDSELYITAHNPKTVFEYIADTMGRYALVENQEAADNARLRNLKKKLVQLLGDDIEPLAPVVGGVKRPNSGRGGTRTAKERTAVRRSTRSRAAVQVEELDSEPEVPTKKRRKRKTREVSQDEGGSGFDTAEEWAKGATPKRRLSKKVTSHRASKRRSTARSQKLDPEAVGLTENVVSNFLKALQPETLTRMMSNLGIEVVSKASNPSFGVVSTKDNAMSAVTPIEVLPTFYDSFDDSLPGTLPDTWADPPSYTGPPKPTWLRFATKLPSKWPEDLPIAHVSPWLEALHVPHEHRAHSVISNCYVLRDNHHAVYIRAAHAFYKQRLISELPELPPRFGRTITTNEKLWCAAVTEDDVALEFFGAKKEQLSTEGFCILESFLQDEQIPDRIGAHIFCKFRCPNPFFKSLEEEAKESFPKQEALTDPSARTTWNITQNVSSAVDSEDVIRGQGRFRMTNYGIMERLETDPEKIWTINGRALVDIRVAQCLAALKVAQKPREKRVFMPRTGGRWIMTSPECRRQVLHTDFKPLSRQETLSENKCPGFFTIATGELEVPLWVCSHSHRLAATTSATKLRAASSASTVHMIRVPPFSVFVGRGDLHYSGLATGDAIHKLPSIYYHTFFVPEDADLPRVLSRNLGFNPRFRANLDEESEEGEEEIMPAPSSSRNQPSVVDSDDNYHSDELRGSSDNGQGSADNDVDYSQYL